MYGSILEVPQPQEAQLEKELRALGVWGRSDLYMYHKPELFDDRSGPYKFVYFLSREKLSRSRDLLRAYDVAFDTNVGGYDFCKHPIEYEDIVVWNLFTQARSERLFLIHSPLTIYAVMLGVKTRRKTGGRLIYDFLTCVDCATKRIGEERHKAKEREIEFDGPESSRLVASVIDVIPVSRWNDIEKGKEEWKKLRKSLGVKDDMPRN